MAEKTEDKATAKKKKATAKNLIKSKDNYVAEITIKRGEEEFVLQLQPITAEAHAEIFDKKAPTPPSMLLPKVKDGHILQGEDKVWRYMEDADLQNPELPADDQKKWDDYVEKLQAHNKRANQALVFAILPDHIKTEFDEKYKQRTPENVDKFLNEIFMVGELNSLYAEVYPRVCNALGVEYGPFSALDFLKKFENGNPLGQD